MEPTEERYQAATGVNAVSPETHRNFREADRFWRLEGSIVSSDRVSLKRLSRGLRQWHDMERNVLELGRPVQILEMTSIHRQAEKDKEVEKFVRESDSLILVMKRGNARGAKGAALICRDSRRHNL